MPEIDSGGVERVPFQPLSSQSPPNKTAKIRVPSIPREGSRTALPLAGRVKQGAVSGEKNIGFFDPEKESNEKLIGRYNEGFYWAGYELVFRALQGKIDSSWQDEANDKANLGFERAQAANDPGRQKQLAFRYLVGLGTALNEEKFFRVIRGQNPDNGNPIKGWQNLTDDPLVNYQYFRFLYTFQKDTLFKSLDPKALTMIDCLEKSAKAGHPKAQALWEGEVGKELRSMRFMINNALEKR